MPFSLSDVMPPDIGNPSMRRRLFDQPQRRQRPVSKNLHNPDSTDQALNQNNQMSDDPGDGSRKSFVLGKDGNTPVERAPKQDAQDQSTIEAFGKEGAGIAAKE
jgi:hypothetical protein